MVDSNIAVRIDIVEGNSGELTIDGWRFTRVAKMSNVTGTGAARLKNAVDALIATVGNIGAEHPSVSNCRIVGFSPESASTPDIVVVRINYVQRYGAAKVTVGSSLTQMETNKNYNGDLITLQYTYPSGYQLDTNKAGKTIVQGGMAQIQVPSHSMVFRRTESSGSGNYVGTKARTYVGKVCNGGWSLDTECSARQWMCMGIVGESEDGGVTYQVTYTFEYKEETWDQTFIFINPDDGKPPHDLVNGVGIVTDQMYTEVDFDDILD